MVIEAIQTLADLKKYPLWVVADFQKAPYTPGGSLAKANDESTWSQFTQVWSAFKNNPERYMGVGFEFKTELGIVGVDLDKCIDDAGNVSEYAQHVVTLLNSYTEYSISGRGLHLLVRGSIPCAIGPDSESAVRIEMYNSGRYFITTGKRLPGTPETIEERQEQLSVLHSDAQQVRMQEKAAKRSTEAARTPIKTSQSNCTPYGTKALQNECSELANMPEGGRNARLYDASLKMGSLIAGKQLEENTVISELTEAARRSGLDEREIERTLTSGLKAGMKSPRAPEPTSKAIDELIYGKAHETKNKNGCVDPEYVLECLAQGEYGDSLLFARLFRGLVLFDHTAAEWYTWGGHYWEPDGEEGKIKHLVSGKLASEYLKAAAALNLQASQSVAKAELSDDEEEKAEAKERVSKIKGIVKQLSERAFSLRQVSRCRNIQYFACSHKGMGIKGNQWDRNTWLLGVPNGVIDLRLGECRPGNPEDYIRTVSPTEWKGLNCLAPRWERFLQEIFEDRAPEEREILLQFFQRLLGYGITGEVREHVFAVLFGEDGRNGKDTVQRALTRALGSASGVIQKDVLLETGKGHSAGAPTPHLSDLQGRRLAWASEPEKGQRFNVGQIKELSGGGDIPTRGLHEKKITKLKPSHLLLLLTNHKPHAAADDSAFWNRLIMITFNMRFVDEPLEPNERKKDTTLWDTLEEETSGILAWLVRGCLSWQEQGLDIPTSVKEDGQKYREEEDQLRLFLSECCVIKPECMTKASNLYAAYETWGKDGNLYVMNKMLFGLGLGKKKFQKKTTMNGIYYQGIGIIDPDHEDHMNTLNEVFIPSKHTSQADPGIEGNTKHEYYEHLTGVFTESDPHEGPNMEKPDKSIHSIHIASEEEDMNPPVGCSEEGMNTLNEVFISNQEQSIHTPEVLASALLKIGKYLKKNFKDETKEVVFWSVPGVPFSSEKENGMLTSKQYYHRIKAVLESGDSKKIQSALDVIESKTMRDAG